MDKCAANGDPLLHAAGELARILVFKTAQSGKLQKLKRFLSVRSDIQASRFDL